MLKVGALAFMVLAMMTQPSQAASDICESGTCLAGGGIECELKSGDCPPCVYKQSSVFVCYSKSNGKCPFEDPIADCSENSSETPSKTTSSKTSDSSSKKETGSPNDVPSSEDAKKPSVSSKKEHSSPSSGKDSSSSSGKKDSSSSKSSRSTKKNSDEGSNVSGDSASAEKPTESTATKKHPATASPSPTTTAPPSVEDDTPSPTTTAPATSTDDDSAWASSTSGSTNYGDDGSSQSFSGSNKMVTNGEAKSSEAPAYLNIVAIAAAVCAVLLFALFIGYRVKKRQEDEDSLDMKTPNSPRNAAMATNNYGQKDAGYLHGSTPSVASTAQSNTDYQSNQYGGYDTNAYNSHGANFQGASNGAPQPQQSSRLGYPDNRPQNSVSTNNLNSTVVEFDGDRMTNIVYNGSDGDQHHKDNYSQSAQMSQQNGGNMAAAPVAAGGQQAFVDEDIDGRYSTFASNEYALHDSRASQNPRADEGVSFSGDLESNSSVQSMSVLQSKDLAGTSASTNQSEFDIIDPNAFNDPNGQRETEDMVGSHQGIRQFSTVSMSESEMSINEYDDHLRYSKELEL